MLAVYEESFEVASRGRGVVPIGEPIAAVVARAQIRTGTLTVFVRHTSASLLIQENADPKVHADLLAWLGDLAPEARPWSHAEEGPDDMPAHAKAAVLRTAETIPISGGRLVLGTWQGIYLVEHRARPHPRRLHVTIVGTR